MASTMMSISFESRLRGLLKRRYDVTSTGARLALLGSEPDIRPQTRTPRDRKERPTRTALDENFARGHSKSEIYERPSHRGSARRRRGESDLRKRHDDTDDTDLTRRHDDSDLRKRHDDTDLTRRRDDSDLRKRHNDTDLSRRRDDSDLRKRHDDTDLRRRRGDSDLRRSHDDPDLRRRRDDSDLRRRYDESDIQRRHDLYISKYGIQNTSTKLVMLNNKYKREGSARMKSALDARIRDSQPDVNPYRHRPWERSRSFTDRHTRCQSAPLPRFQSSKAFDFPNRPDTTFIGDYLFENKPTVNHHRHRNCYPPPKTPLRPPASARLQTPLPLLPISGRRMELSPLFTLSPRNASPDMDYHPQLQLAKQWA